MSSAAPSATSPAPSSAPASALSSAEVEAFAEPSAARLVLGGRLVAPRAIDLAEVGVVFSVDGRLSETATGGAAEGHPAAAVAWLANRLAADDQRLRAGDIVLAGGLTAPVDLRSGTVVSVEAAGLGTVSCYGEEAS